MEGANFKRPWGSVSQRKMRSMSRPGRPRLASRKPNNKKKPDRPRVRKVVLCPAASHRPGHRSFPDPPVAAALRIILLGDTRLGQTDELGERRVRPAGTARQCRGKGCHSGAPVPVECAQVDVAGSAAGGAARPQEPVAGRDGRAGSARTASASAWPGARSRRSPAARHPRGSGDRLRVELQLPSRPPAGGRPPFCAC